MPILTLLFGGCLLSFPAITVLLSVVFVRVAWRAHRQRRPLTVAVCGAALVSLLASFCAVGVVWFAYAVSHSGKNATSDLKVLLFTCLPFHLLAYGLWRTVRNQAARLDAPADPSQDAGKNV